MSEYDREKFIKFPLIKLSCFRSGKHQNSLDNISDQGVKILSRTTWQKLKELHLGDWLTNRGLVYLLRIEMPELETLDLSK